jgi:hypothetical protein
MLYELIVKSKINTYRSRITSSNTINISNGIYREFKYQYSHPIIPPSLVSLNDKKFIVPEWIEVHPNTELTDIEWIKPIKEYVKPNIEIIEFKSSSSSEIHRVTIKDGKMKCSCMGFFRGRGKCKHTKEVEESRK